MNYINRKLAGHSRTNRTTQAEISNVLWLGSPGRVIVPVSLVSTGTKSAGHSKPETTQSRLCR